MCRDIKPLRPPYASSVTGDDVRAAAFQYIATVSGYRRPAPEIADAFNQAVETVDGATRALLGHLGVELGPSGGPDGLAPAGDDLVNRARGSRREPHAAWRRGEA